MLGGSGDGIFYYTYLKGELKIQGQCIVSKEILGTYVGWGGGVVERL